MVLIRSLTVFLAVAATLAMRPHSGQGGERLIVFLVDGVRWDYLTRDDQLKGFPRMARNGVRAEYVQPIFPSNSYPNWYSIVTGLYAENHGFVQNYMYDTQIGDTFLMTPHPNASHEHWWNQSEPIWVTSEKAAKKVSMYWWDGCQVKIRGIKPTECTEYEDYWAWPSVKEDTEEALGDILTWFETSKDNKLAMIYYEGVDAIGHFRGPESEEVKTVVREIDSILDRFLDSLQERGMNDQVNLVVVSDHGMAVSRGNDVKLIELDKHDVKQDIELMLDRGSMSMILPVEGREEQLYQKLKNADIKGLHVYKKEDIPERFHWKNNDLVMPILLTADEGYFIKQLSDANKMKPYSSKLYKGFHGYDPEVFSNMRTIFYAQGPSFKVGYQSPPMKMVDHYNIFCRILDIDPLPNNGSLPIAEGFFRSHPRSQYSPYNQNNGAQNTFEVSFVAILISFLVSLDKGLNQ